MNRKLVGALAMAMLAGGYLTPASAAPAAKSDYIIVFKSGATDSGVNKALSKVNAKTKGSFKDVFNGAVVNISDADAATLKLDPSIQIIEKDGKVTASDLQVNPPSWGLDRIDQRSLSPLSGTFTYPTSAGAGVTAYIVDTGVSSVSGDFNATDSSGNVISRLNSGCSAVGATSTSATACIAGAANDDSNSGHGTHVAGTVAGTTYGIAKLARVTPIKVLDSTGSGSYSGVIAGLNWVIANHQQAQSATLLRPAMANTPAVLNMSLGGPTSAALDAAVNSVIADGIVVTVAAGNDKKDACNYSPSRVSGALTVGATGNWNTSTSAQNDVMATYSNYGKCVDLFAPGTYIISASNKDTTPVKMSGTSMATPHVSGVAALLLGKNSTWSVTQVVSEIKKSTNPKITLIAPASTTNTPGNTLLQSPTS